MILKSFGSLSVTLARAGGVSVAAFATSSPYPRCRRARRVVHGAAAGRALGLRHVPGLRPRRSPASRARGADAAQRSQWSGVAVLPPANCAPVLALVAHRLLDP